MPLLDPVNYQSCRSNCWLNQSTTDPSITMPTISMIHLLRANLARRGDCGPQVAAQRQSGGNTMKRDH
jgi:hypothetical protein